MNVVVAIPSYGQTKNVFAISLAKLVAYFTQHRVDPESPEQAMDFAMREGSGVGSNRDYLIDQALAKPGMTHVLFIDEDMMFKPHTLHVLASRRLPIVGCNYRMRTPPAEFTALATGCERRVETTLESTGVEECVVLGFGFCLIERQVFEALPRPRFLAFYADDHYSTEDTPFFLNARKEGFVAHVDHDASKLIAHRGDMTYHWNRTYSTL